MKFYRKQPLEAEQFDGSQKLIFGYSIIPSGLVDAITGKPVYYSALVDDICQDSDDDTGIVLDVGDWIVKEADEIEVIADDVFKKTYAELPVIPEEVSLSIKDWKKHSRGLDQIFGMVYQYEITRTQGSTTINWIMCGNQDAFARAWLDGYVVEEDNENFKSSEPLV